MWKTIPNFEKYEISNDGKIRSYQKDWNGKILKQKTDKDGYKEIGLYKNGEKYYFRVHRLVLSVYNPIENESEFEVNHKNGIKDDNRIENLEWCTPLENTRHAIKLGNRDPRKGEDNGMSKLTKNEVLEIVKLNKDTDMTHKEISNNYNVGRSTITRVLNGVLWSEVTGIKN